MMSAAISMAASTEQSGVGVVASSEQHETEIPSFAHSFDERIGIISESPGGYAANHVNSEIGSPKVAVSAKRLEGTVAAPAGVKEKGSMEEGVAVRPEGKNSAQGNSIGRVFADTAGLHAGNVAEDVETIKPEVPDTKIPSDSLTESSDSSTDSSTSLFEGQVAKASIPAAVGVETQTSVSISTDAVVKKEIGCASKTDDSGSLKTPVKMQDGLVTEKGGHKRSEKILTPNVRGTKVDVGSNVQITMPPTAEVVSSSAAANSAVPERIKHGFDAGAPEKGRSSVGVATVASQSDPSTETVRGTTGVVTKSDTSATSPVASLDEQVASMKSSTEMPKLVSSAIASASDRDSKSQSAVSTMAHALAGGEGIAAGGVPFVAGAPTMISGNEAKLPVGTAVAHGANLAAGGGETDGSFASATSMYGVPRALAATQTTLEVGIQSGTHGWLKVRAEMTDGGDVNASVSATSTAGQEMLHRELPALTTYLQEEKVAVNAIVIHPVATAGGEPQSSTTDTGGESGGLMQQRDQQGGQRQEDVVKTATGRVNEAVIHSNSNGMSDDGSLSSATNAAGGSWLSVRA